MKLPLSEGISQHAGSGQGSQLSEARVGVANQENPMESNYDRAAWFYEKAAKVYSTNQIRASKRFQLNYIEPGDKVLYLGAGTGEDAIMAA